MSDDRTLTDLFGVNVDNDARVRVDVRGRDRMFRLTDDEAQRLGHALIGAADRAARQKPVVRTLWRGAPPRPGQPVYKVDRDGHPVDHKMRRVTTVNSEYQATLGRPVDRVWLDDESGPYVRQIDFDVYRLCTARHDVLNPIYLAR